MKDSAARHSERDTVCEGQQAFPPTHPQQQTSPVGGWPRSSSVMLLPILPQNTLQKKAACVAASPSDGSGPDCCPPRPFLFFFLRRFF